ncbi:MAG: hypothetical protein V7643_3391, partial [Mycobacterium sp.]
ALVRVVSTLALSAGISAFGIRCGDRSAGTTNEETCRKHADTRREAQMRRNFDLLPPASDPVGRFIDLYCRTVSTFSYPDCVVTLRDDLEQQIISARAALRVIRRQTDSRATPVVVAIKQAGSSSRANFARSVSARNSISESGIV